jgi:WD40 repeat protein
MFLFLLFMSTPYCFAQQTSPQQDSETGVIYPQPAEILKGESQLRFTIEPIISNKVSALLPVYKVLFLSNNKLLATGDSSGGIKLLSVPDLKIQNVLAGHTNSIFGLAATGKFLASSGKDGTVHIWSIPSGKIVKVLPSAQVTVPDVEFSRDGTVMATCNFNKKIDLWNVTKGFEYLTSLTGHDGSIYNVAFSPDGTLLASCGRDRTVRLWSLATLKENQTISGHGHIVLDCDISPKGDYLASVGVDGLLIVWALGNGQATTPPLFFYPQGTWATALRFSPQGDYIITASRKGDIRIFHSPSFNLVGLFSAFPEGEPILSLDISGDGKYVAVSTKTGEVRLFDWGKILSSIKPHAETK